LNCADTSHSGESTWVGTGGVGNNPGSLLQTGVLDNCVDGVQEDFGWWEEWPSNPNYATDFSDFQIAPGNSIEASVYQNTAGQWVTRLDNLTTGVSGWMVIGATYGVGTDASGTFTDQGSTAGLTYSGGYTAEWIVEDPSTASGTTPFANYGTVVFSNLQLAGLSPWYLTVGEGWEMVQNGVALSMPSAPSSAGFSVNYVGP
jgi:hypothetical protein